MNFCAAFQIYAKISFLEICPYYRSAAFEGKLTGEPGTGLKLALNLLVRGCEPPNKL